MDLTFLEAADGTPLTKTFILKNDVLTTLSYPHISEFSSTTLKVKTLKSVENNIKKYSDLGFCLLKGTLDRPLKSERRAGATNPETLTLLAVLDADGIKWADSAESVMKRIGLGHVSYIEQLSASAGIKKDRGYSAHIFILLDKPMKPSDLKLWLMHLNLTYLEDDIQLNAAATTLKWPIDISVCQNDKLIYIAPPKCVGFKAPTIERVTYHKKKHSTLCIEDIPLKTVTKALERKLMNTRRVALGLKRKTYQVRGDILTNPDKSDVTGIKRDRGFVYLNLAGGDSWGYYFPEDNPDILYNFKGEPNVRLKDIAPDFYTELIEEGKEEVVEASTEEGTIYSIGLDLVSDRFMRITHNPGQDLVNITYTGARANAFDFLKQHGRPKPDFIPTWDSFCDFSSGETIDFERRRINRYMPTTYMRNAGRSTELPPTIKLVIEHVFAYDAEVIEHFLNWLAVIFQKKIMTLTSWVVGGTQGTGKGILFDKIISPILGPAHCNKVSLSTFEKEFNGFLEDCLILFIDEIQASEIKKHAAAMANIKKNMANHRIDIRRMRRDTYVIDNYCNFIFASNKFDALEIDPDDRRFNVSPRQEVALREVVDLHEIEVTVEAELQRFTDYIMSRKANINEARRIIDTSERGRLQAATENTTMSIASRIRAGDFDFFMEAYVDAKDLQVEFELATRIKDAPSFKDVMEYMYAHRETSCQMPRNHLAVLFFYTADIRKNTPHAFSKFLGYHGFNLQVVTFDNKATRGIVIPLVTTKDEKAWRKIEPNLRPVSRTQRSSNSTSSSKSPSPATDKSDTKRLGS